MKNPSITNPESLELLSQGGATDDTCSPLQARFNFLAKKIETLRQKRQTKEEKSNELLDFWTKRVYVYRVASVETISKLAHAIEKQSLQFRLGSLQKKTVINAIVQLLDFCFMRATPSEEDQELFNRCSDAKYDEIVLEQQEQEFESVRSFFKMMYDIEIERELFEQGPDVVHEVILEKLKTAQEQVQAELGAQKPPRKKTKKQLEKEALEQQAEEFRSKTVRSLYLSLVKVLHPDIETDAQLREKKETIMKKLTVAYEANDIHTLLCLERAWLDEELHNSRDIPEDRLKVFIKVLEEQVKELEGDLFEVFNDPKYRPIANILNFSHTRALSTLKKQEAEYKKTLDFWTGISKIFDTITSKSEFLGLVLRIDDWIQ